MVRIRISLLAACFFCLAEGMAQIENYPLAHLASRPARVSAFDVSQDGEWLATGGNGQVCVESLVDGQILFSENVKVGRQISYIKLSPDKTLLAVWSSEIIIVYDLVNNGKPFMTDIGKIKAIAPQNNSSEQVTNYVNAFGKSFTEAAVKHEQTFRFTGSSLLYIEPRFAIEIFLTKEKKPVIRKVKSDYGYVADKTAYNTKYEFYYSMLPWNADIDSIKQRTYRKIAFDVTLTYGMVEYDQAGKRKIQVWDLVNGTNTFSTTVPAESQAELDKIEKFELDPSGKYLYYYKETGRDRATFSITGEVRRLDITSFINQKLFEPSNKKPVGKIQVSEDNKFVFCESFDIDSVGLKAFLSGNDANNSIMLTPKLWTYVPGNGRLMETRLNEHHELQLTHSATSGDCFIAAGKNVYRLHMQDSSLSLLNKWDGTPTIVNVEFEDTTHMFLVADDGIRRFNYYSMNQEAYYPVANIDLAAFNDSVAYLSDNNSISAYHMRTGVQRPLYAHKRKVGGLLYHKLSGAILSADYNHVNTWSDSCALYTVAVNADKTSSLKILLPNTPVLTMALSPDQQWLAVVTQASRPDTARSSKNIPGYLQVFKYENGSWTKKYTLDTSFEHSRQSSGIIAFSRDNRFLAHSNSKLEIGIWDLSGGNKIANCAGEHGDARARYNYELYKEANKLSDYKAGYQITGLAFQPDGTLVSMGDDNRICFWTRSGTTKIPVYKFSTVTHFTKTTAGFILSKDALQMIINCTDGSVVVYDTTGNSFDKWLVMKKYTDGYTLYMNPISYYSNHNAHDQIYFSNNKKSISYEELDLHYNNPHYMYRQIMFPLDSLKLPKWAYGTFIISWMNDAIIRDLRFTQYGRENRDFFKVDSLQRPLVKINNRQELAKLRSTNLDSVKLDIQVTTNGQPVSRIHIWVNGVTVYGNRGLPIGTATAQINRSVWIKLSPGENRMQVACQDKNGMLSDRKSVMIYKNNTGFKPDLYLVTLGVDRYEDQRLNLQYATKDCKDLADLFQSNKTLYRDIIKKSLFNGDLTIPAVLNLWQTMAKTRPGDVVIVYYSGHGFLSGKNRELYLGLSKTDLSDKRGTALPYKLLDSLLGTVNCRQRLLLLDACGSGPVNPGNTGKPEDNIISGAKGSYEQLSKDDSLFIRMKEMYPDLRPSTGTITIAAATGYQYAQELDSLQNSVFTHAILNAFKPLEGRVHARADFNKDYQVDVSELLRFSKQAVFMINSLQTPTSRSVNLLNDFRIW